MAIAKVLIAACGGAIAASVLWVVLSQFGGFFGVPKLPQLPLGIFAVSGAFLAACTETMRQVVERKRRRLNRAVAEELGADYFDSVTWIEIRSLPDVSLFQHDSSRASNRMVGTRSGRPFDVFDFRYTVTSQGSDGTSSSTFTQTVFRFPDAAGQFPRFLLKPRHRLTGLLNRMFGGTEVELAPPTGISGELVDSFAQFRKHYQLTIPSDVDNDIDLELQQLLHPFVVGWLSLHPGWTIETKAGDLVAWRSDSVAVGMVRVQQLDELCELLTLLSASELAEQNSEPVRIDVRERHGAGGLSGLIGVWIGMMLGVLAGGALSMLTIWLVLRFAPPRAPVFPVVAAAFLVCTLPCAIIGGYLGLRIAHRSNRGRRRVQNLTPHSVADDA